jgi:hypothetical protein
MPSILDVVGNGDVGVRVAHIRLSTVRVGINTGRARVHVTWLPGVAWKASPVLPLALDIYQPHLDIDHTRGRLSIHLLAVEMKELPYFCAVLGILYDHVCTPFAQNEQDGTRQTLQARCITSNVRCRTSAGKASKKDR